MLICVCLYVGLYTRISVLPNEQAPETPLEPSSVERQTEAFIKFTSKMDDSVQSLYRTAQDQMKKCQGPYKRECLKVSDAFRDLAIAFELDTSNLDTQLNASIKHTGDTYEDMGRLYDENLRHNWENMADTLYEYRGKCLDRTSLSNLYCCVVCFGICRH